MNSQMKTTLYMYIILNIFNFNLIPFIYFENQPSCIQYEQTNEEQWKIWKVNGCMAMLFITSMWILKL